MLKSLTCALAALALSSCALAAAAQTYPSLPGPGGTKIAPAPTAVTGLDSATSAPCIIGSSTTCQLPVSGASGGGSSVPDYSSAAGSPNTGHVSTVQGCPTCTPAPVTAQGSAGTALASDTADGGLQTSDQLSPTAAVSTSGATFSAGTASFTATSQNVVIDLRHYGALSVSVSGAGLGAIAVNCSDSATGPWVNASGTTSNNYGTFAEGTAINSNSQWVFNACGRYMQLASTSWGTGTESLVLTLMRDPRPARGVFATLPTNITALRNTGFAIANGTGLAASATSTATYRAAASYLWASYYGCRVTASQAYTATIMETLAGGTGIVVSSQTGAAGAVTDLAVRVRGAADTYGCTVTNTNATAGTYSAADSFTAN